MRPSKPDLIRTLRRLPLFTDLSDDELSSVAENVTRVRYEKGRVIFSEGDACHELLIVEEGSVKILKSATNGRLQLIGIGRRGNALAVEPVLDGGRYVASAEAASTTVLLCLPAEGFLGVCLKNPELALKVFKVLAGRLRHLARLVEDLSFSTVRSRLVAHLVRLAEDTGHETARGIEFRLPENNEELAARLGTVRELVSRNLGRLHGAGLIEMRRRAICVPSMSLLKEEIKSD